MSTSDTNQAKKTGFVYLCIAIFCAVFGAIYEIFSHGVYSYYMIYAFMFPLVGGAFIFYIISNAKNPVYPSSITGNMYHSGIATLTVGSIFNGILKIYGTTNRLTTIYWIVGIIMIVTGIICYAIEMYESKGFHNQ